MLARSRVSSEKTARNKTEQIPPAEQIRTPCSSVVEKSGVRRAQVMRATGDLLTPRAESFEVFGFDVMVDEAMKLWLLEVNLSPGCESRTTFMEKMLTRMSDRLVEVAVLGREAPDGEEPDWIKIYDDSGNAGNAASGPPRSAEDLRIQGTQLRIGKTKGASKPQEAHVAFTAEEADRSSHESKEKVRKGTGYVSLSELPDDEEIPPGDGKMSPIGRDIVIWQRLNVRAGRT